MKKEDLLSALGEAGEPFAEDAAPKLAEKRKNRLLPFALSAAAVAVIALAMFALPKLSGPVHTPDATSDAAPSSASLPTASQPEQPTEPTPSVPDVHTPLPSAEVADLGLSSDFLLSSPVFPKQLLNPAVVKQGIQQDYYERWFSETRERRQTYAAGNDGAVADFTRRTLPDFLSSEGENKVVSPLNVYLALSMLSEVTDGEAHDRLLSLLAADSPESLRARCKKLWNAHFVNDGATTSVLGASMWLRSGFDYNLDTLTRLSDDYFASAFAGDMSDPAYSADLQTWLSKMTGGLLDTYVSDVRMSDETLMSLLTTVLYRVKWQEEFYEGNTRPGTFRAPSGDREVDFLRATKDRLPVFYGERFQAVELPLADGGAMRILLSDAGETVSALLSDDETLSFLTARKWEQGSGVGYYLPTDRLWPQMKNDAVVHLSIPKFDVSSDADLKAALTTLGLGALFTPGAADFSPLFAATPENEALKATSCVGKIEHAARVTIDEEGVSAAAYTQMELAGAAPPPDLEIDFTVDRPFLFALVSADFQPLFVGAVYEP